jgi:hypothetical protein
MAMFCADHQVVVGELKGELIAQEPAEHIHVFSYGSCPGESYCQPGIGKIIVADKG